MFPAFTTVLYHSVLLMFLGLHVLCTLYCLLSLCADRYFLFFMFQVHGSARCFLFSISSCSQLTVQLGCFLFSTSSWSQRSPLSYCDGRCFLFSSSSCFQCSPHDSVLHGVSCSLVLRVSCIFHCPLSLVVSSSLVLHPLHSPLSFITAASCFLFSSSFLFFMFPAQWSRIQ